MYDTLVLSGGSTSAIAFVGCVRYMEHAGIMGSVRTMVGTSFGAILALLLCAGMDSAAIEAWLSRQVKTDVTALDAEAILEFPERMGLDDGQRAMACLASAVHDRIGLEPNVTFRDFAKATGRNLVVCVANISLVRREFFGVDTTPDLSVLLAVRMSFGIPLIFTPVRHDGWLYVDGGIFDNCPVDFVTSARNASNALVLRISNQMGPILEPCNDVAQYLWMLVNAMVTQANDRPSAAPDAAAPVRIRVVDVASPAAAKWGSISMHTMSFQVDDAVISDSVQVGYSAMEGANVCGVDV
jgi:predicted acylesterase/phospholipase RssA